MQATEQKIEEVRFSVQGIEKVVDIVVYPGTDIQARAYFRDGGYYDIDVFERGIKKADHVERYGLLEQDYWTN